MIRMISSDYFAKMFSHLVQVTDSPAVGVMCAAIESLTEIWSNPDPFISIPAHLSF